MTTISIITPCYNAASFIQDTILSILLQRGDFAIQYIVVDGASTDETVSMVQAFKEMVDSGRFRIRCNGIRFEVISEPDTGMYDALVKGFARATGDIVAYINGDDFYQGGAFSTVTEIFGKYPEVNWVSGKHLYYNELGETIGTNLPLKYDRTWIKRGMYGTTLPFIQQEAVFWRKRMLDVVDMDRLRTFKMAGDFYLWHTFAQYTELYIVNSLLGGFRFRPNQLSKQMDRYYKEFLAIADDMTRWDLFVGRFVNKLFHVLSDETKVTLNRLIIRYHTNGWWKPDTARFDRIRGRIPSRKLREFLHRLYP